MAKVSNNLLAQQAKVERAKQLIERRKVDGEDYVYSRRNSESLKDNSGIQAQLERINDWFISQGLEMPTQDRLFCDDGKSGKRLDGRDHLNKLIELIKEGQVRRVVIYKLDHLARSSRLLLELWADVFQAYGAELVSVSETFDTSTSAGRMALKILGDFTEMDRENIYERMNGGRVARANNGERAAGAVPFGYKVTEQHGRKVTVVDDEEAKIVRTMREMRGSRPKFKHTLQNIADWLNAKGVPTRRGGPWVLSSVQYVLENGIYAGEVSYRTTDLNGAQDIIVAQNKGLAIL